MTHHSTIIANRVMLIFVDAIFDLVKIVDIYHILFFSFFYLLFKLTNGILYLFILFCLHRILDFSKVLINKENSVTN